MKFGLELAGGNEELAATPQHTALLLYLSWKMKAPAFAELNRDGFLQVYVGCVHLCLLCLSMSALSVCLICPFPTVCLFPRGKSKT